MEYLFIKIYYTSNDFLKSSTDEIEKIKHINNIHVFKIPSSHSDDIVFEMVKL